ncbi:MAG TPA: CHAP domain-containing protein [Rhodopila sp.]|jgi:surface antigen|nr:CHAP domain-containing protein [Rhodopila sp.]
MLVPLLCLAAAACGHGGTATSAGTVASVECAPFARALTGVALSGSAAEWWSQAAGRYQRSHRPAVGSLLVFRRSSRLPEGHVAVVSRIVGRRQIMVTQANWVRHRVNVDQPVLDVSAEGDWSRVQVWWPPSGQMGVTAYPVFGFIHPTQPPDHDQILAATPGAIRIAAGAD